ncbi:MAG: DUF2157 domain-containing protein [Parvibaculum sp.]|nr:DUF2157 domain-containing protein [Parvibaculum sp.]
MWQRIYLERLKRDLERWIERGWVTPAHAQNILSEMDTGAGARHVPQVLAIMGAVLFGFAAMSFVAANWAEMPKSIRLLMLFGSLWTAWGAAFFAERRGHSAYAEAGVIAGLALFGANIMLIAQIYHVDAGTPTWLLLWSLVALAAAWGLPSRSALAISFLLTTLWSTWAVQNESAVHWAFLLPWVAATWLTVQLSWRAGLHLSLITLCIWLVASADRLIDLIGCGQGDLTALYALASLLLWIAGLRISASSLRFGSILETYGMIITFGLIWTLQVHTGDSHAGFKWTALALIGMAGVGALAFAEVSAARLSLRDYVGLVAAGLGVVLYPLIAEHGNATMLIYAALFMALTIWLVAYGTNRHHRIALNAGLIAFTGECLYLYFQTLGTLLDTATFFALGGIILIAGSLILPRIRRRLVASVNEGEPK